MDIVERLLARKKIAPTYSGMVVRSTGRGTPPCSISQPCEYPTALVNPDGEQAAAEIEALRERNETLQAEVERLRRQLVMG